MSATVICVGLPVLDLVHRVDAIPTQPVKMRARAFATSVGGMASGAACAIARLGGRAQFWGPVGDDAFGTTIRDEFRQAGVEVDVAPLTDTTSSHSVVFVDPAGERLLVNHRGSACEASADILPQGPVAAAAMLTDVRWAQGCSAALDRARAAGVPTVLDAEMGDPQALRDLVPRAGHVIFSEHGFREWAGTDAGTDRARAALTGLVESGAQLAAVTLGARGVDYAHGGIVDRMPAFDVRAVETLGAGDVFHGAYALAIAEGRDVAAALRFASAAAALRCTRAGGRAALPDRAAVDALLAH